MSYKACIFCHCAQNRNPNYLIMWIKSPVLAVCSPTLENMAGSIPVICAGSAKTIRFLILI